MDALLRDLMGAVQYDLAREVETAPAAYRETARINADLEARDYREQLLACDDDRERVQATRRWLRALT